MEEVKRKQRKPGRQITKDSPIDVYNRKRQNLWYKLKKGLISDYDYDNLMIIVSHDYKEAKKNQKLTKFLN